MEWSFSAWPISPLEGRPRAVRTVQTHGRFAPLNIPPHRRLQTAAVALWALLLPICMVAFLLCMSFPPLWVIMIPYCIWIQFDTAPDRGGRAKGWARRSFVWKYFAGEQLLPASFVRADSRLLSLQVGEFTLRERDAKSLTV
jgi:hypothetical protein